MWTLCAASAASLLLTVPTPPEPRGPLDADGFSGADIVVFYSCSAACNADTPPTDDNPMCLSYGLQREGGWPKLMTTHILGDYQDGYRRFLLHLPFGTEFGNGGMDLDQPIDSIEAGEGHVLRDFFDAVEWAQDYMPEAEFIVYLGRDEGDIKQAYTNDDRYFDHWNRISGAGWNMLLLDYPNVSVAFDAGTNYLNGVGEDWSPGDPYFQLVKLFQSYKARQRRHVYIEAIPRNALTPSVSDPEPYEWQRTMPWIAMEDSFLQQIKRWVDHDPPLETPEGIRCLIRQQDLAYWQDHGGSIGWAAHCIRHGHTPAINRFNPIFPWHRLTADEAAVLMVRNLE